MSLRCASIFSQVLSVINRRDFGRAVRVTKAEKGAKGFSSWDQFVAMMFCQLAQAKSLREIDAGLRSCEGKLRHLGVRRLSGSLCVGQNLKEKENDQREERHEWR